MHPSLIAGVKNYRVYTRKRGTKDFLPREDHSGNIYQAATVGTFLKGPDILCIWTDENKKSIHAEFEMIPGTVYEYEFIPVKELE